MENVAGGALFCIAPTVPSLTLLAPIDGAGAVAPSTVPEAEAAEGAVETVVRVVRCGEWCHAVHVHFSVCIVQLSTSQHIKSGGMASQTRTFPSSLMMI